MNNIKVLIFGKEVEIAKDSTLLDLSKNYQNKFNKPIIIAKVNGFYKELFHRVHETCEIEFYDATDIFSNRVYVNGLILLVNYAFRELYGLKDRLRVLHSIDKGLYFESGKRLSKDIIIEIKNKMDDVVKLNLNIEKVNVSRVEAIKYFKDTNNLEKAKLLNYTTNTYITLYKIGNMYEYLYSLMPTNTNVFSEFDLTYIDDEGFVLQFPTPYQIDIQKYKHHQQMFDVFDDYRSWKELMNLGTVADLNAKVSSGKISDIIRIDEVLQSNRLLELARTIQSKKNTIKIVLLSGPSSSGKTTTCKKLAMYLESFGLHPKALSMDDYYKENKDAIIKEDGTPDYECLEAIDLDLFNTQVSELLDGKTVTIPTFNFLFGTKEFKTKMHLDENDILMIEGIHGLNSNILTNIEPSKKYKVYLSPLIELNIDNLTKVSTTDNRLLRRIVRDNRNRAHDAIATLASWNNVREGEEKYIFTCQDNADFTLNTALSYEIGVLKIYAEPLLYSVPVDSIYYDEAKRLIDFLRFFLTIPSEDVPDDSILREFIGHSCFYE